jgi:hypothetical protein
VPQKAVVSEASHAFGQPSLAGSFLSMKRRAPPDFLEKGSIRPSPSGGAHLSGVTARARFAQIAAFRQNMGEQDLFKQVND